MVFTLGFTCLGATREPARWLYMAVEAKSNTGFLL